MGTANIGKAPVVLPSVLTQDFGGGFSLPSYAIEASLGISAIDQQGREHGLSGKVTMIPQLYRLRWQSERESNHQSSLLNSTIRLVFVHLLLFVTPQQFAVFVKRCAV